LAPLIPASTAGLSGIISTTIIPGISLVETQIIGYSWINVTPDKPCNRSLSITELGGPEPNVDIVEFTAGVSMTMFQNTRNETSKLR
jgi:hypothetical protein